MEFSKKLLIDVLLVMLTLNFYLPSTAMAEQLYVKADMSEHSPQSWSTPEIKIPKEKPKKKGVWWIIGLLLVVGGVAALAGGGGDDDDDTGSFTGSW